MKLFALFAVITTLFLVSCKDKKDINKKPDSNEVVLQLEHALSAKPDSIGLRLLLIDALDSSGMYKKALPHIDSLIKNDSMNYGLLFKKAQLLKHDGDTLQAIKFVNRAVHVYPAPEALLELANLYAETKNIKALEVCSAIEKMATGRDYQSYALFFEAIYSERTGDKTKAIDLLNKSISINYTFIDAHMEKGFIAYDDKNYAEALKIFTLVAEIKSSYSDGYYWQAKCHQAMNNKAEAINQYKKALALDKNNKEAADAISKLENGK